MTRFRIAQQTDLDEIYNFAENEYKKIIPDEFERMIKIWDSRFRKESLEHYLKLGWSFIAEIDQKIEGFILAQPFLFVRGQTQSLWVEDIMASNNVIQNELLEIGYKLSRDKHLQGVMISNQHIKLINDLNLKFTPLDEELLWIKTTK